MSVGMLQTVETKKPDRIQQQLEASAKNAVEETVDRFRRRYKAILLEGNGLKVVDILLPAEMSFEDMLVHLRQNQEKVWASIEFGLHSHGGALDILSLSACRQALEEIIAESGK